MIRSILIPLDGSPLAEQALPLGTSIARRSGASIVLLQVIPIPVSAIGDALQGITALDDQLAATREFAEEYLRTVAQRLEKQGVPTSFATIIGSPGECIAEVADRRKVTAIVMSTHGRAGISRWALGSVTDRVLHLTGRPMFILRSNGAVQMEPPLLPEFKRIVVALDGSPLSEQMLPHATALARAYGAELRLFQSVAFPMMEWGETELAAEWWERVRQGSREYLQRLVEQLHAEDENLQVVYEMGTGAPANAILQYASDCGADLIAMTTHAREGLSRVILGSVADRVVRASHVPVLVLPPAVPARTEED
jgi:nucleotide-binding universal stress UspA family protein